MGRGSGVERSNGCGAGPSPSVLPLDVVALTVGIVLGAGIFKAPSLVAAQAGSASRMLWIWVIGALVSLAGALCYAELATAFPHAGGEYHFLRRALGRPASFLFAWARLTVIPTGSIALLAFVFGDYATQLLPLGARSAAWYAVGMVAALTLVNVAGVKQGTRTQNLLTFLEVLGVLAVMAAGLVIAGPPAAPAADAPVTVSSTSASWGLPLVFVLLTYGGWNEAACLSAEMRGSRRGMAWVLTLSIGVIALLYLGVNLAYLRGLGLEGMARSDALAADLLRQTFGAPGARLISAMVAVSALTSANATLLTGARTQYAFGCDTRLFRGLGQWDQRAKTPVRAILAQGGLALILVCLGTLTRDGFQTMVEYTAPVFWLFFLLAAVSLFVLRVREPDAPRPFRVPLYPWTPLAFCAACAYVLYSSIRHAGLGALAGVAVLALGAFVLFLEGRHTRDRRRPRPPLLHLRRPTEASRRKEEVPT